MATVVLIGIPGETDLWIADLSAGTVTRTAPPATGTIADAQALRSSGATIIKGVDLAVAVSSSSSISSSPLDG